MSRRDSDVFDDAAAQAERPSKTRRKKAMHELQDLGEALAALPAHQLATLEMPESLREAILEYHRTRSHEGRRRQMQYIGKLMRGVDSQPLREAVAALQLGRARDTLTLHQTERWRDELIADDDALTHLRTASPPYHSLPSRLTFRTRQCLLNRLAHRPSHRGGERARQMIRVAVDEDVVENRTAQFFVT